MTFALFFNLISLQGQIPTIDPTRLTRGQSGDGVLGALPDVLVYAASALAGIVVGVVAVLVVQYIRDMRAIERNRPKWPRDWPKDKDIFTTDPNPTKPGYLRLSAGQAIGSGAMPMGRTYPRLRIFPDKYPLRGLRRWVEYATSKPIWIPYMKRFQHFSVLGKTGGGKSTAFAIPILAYGAFEKNTAYFAIDVKSPAFARMFTNIYKKAAKPVLFFDPWSLNETLAFEPLWRASDERKDIIADVIATYSTDAQQQQSSENSEFFRVASIRLLRGLLDLAQFWPRRYCNLPCIQQLVGAGGNAIKEAFEKAADLMPTLDELLAAVERVLPVSAEELRANPRSEGLEGALAVLERSGYRTAFLIKEMRRYEEEFRANRITAQRIEQIREAFWAEIKFEWNNRRERLDALIMNQGEFIQGAEETRNSIVSTLTNKVNWFRDSNIAKAFSRDELDIRALIEGPCLFLVGAPMAKLRVGSLFVASILSNLAINAVFQRGMAIERKDKGVSKHGIFFLLDEFPQLNIKTAPSILATFRGFYSGLAMVYQERSQLRMLYGDDVTTMEGNTVHKVLLQGAQEETAEYYAQKTIGEAPIVKRTKSGPKGEKQSISESVESVSLMSTNDVKFGRLNGRPMPNIALSVGSDVPAFPIRPIAYYEDPTLRKLLGLKRTLKKTGYDGKPTWKFWQWEERWEQPDESPPYLRRKRRLSASERAAGKPDPVYERLQDPFTQYLDYLLGDYRNYDELVAPRLVLEDIGVTDNAPRSPLDGGIGAGKPFGLPGKAPGMPSGMPPFPFPGGIPGLPMEPGLPPTMLVPIYGADIRVLLNGDFRFEVAPVDDEPMQPGGSLRDRIYNGEEEL